MFYLGGKSLRQWEREGKWGREGGVICPVRHCSAGAAFTGFRWRLSRSPCSTPSAQLPDRLHGDEGRQALPSCSPSMGQCPFTLWAAWSDHLKLDLQTSVVAFLTQDWKWQEKTSTLSPGRELAFQRQFSGLSLEGPGIVGTERSGATSDLGPQLDQKHLPGRDCVCLIYTLSPDPAYCLEGSRCWTQVCNSKFNF